MNREQVRKAAHHSHSSTIGRLAHFIATRLMFINGLLTGIKHSPTENLF